jgi:hypothetical protein
MPPSSSIDASAAILESPIQENTQNPIHHGDALQRDDAHFAAIWSSITGDVGKRSVYRTVSVLLISWDDKAGDLNTGEEVSIFKDY